MQSFANAKSFASRANAINKLQSIMGADLETVHWVIIAQEDGRFSPLVLLEGDQIELMADLAHAGVCARCG